MGHMDSKNIFRKLGRKINNLPCRAPWNETLYELLRKLYSEKEADVVVKMPYGLSDLNRVAKVTKYGDLRTIKNPRGPVLERSCHGPMG